MILIIIICLLIAILGLLAIFVIIKHNKFQYLKIKLDKAENNISSFLETKYGILLQKFEFLKNNITVDNDDFDEYKLLNTKIPIDKLNKKVNDLNNLINTYINNNENLYSNESITKFDNEISKVNISINSSKKYYNEHLTEYNNLCKSFPSKIIATIFNYKIKDYIDEDSPETFKILDHEQNDNNDI